MKFEQMCGCLNEGIGVLLFVQQKSTREREKESNKEKKNHDILTFSLLHIPVKIRLPIII
jgi:hypothetical protein